MIDFDDLSDDMKSFYEDDNRFKKGTAIEEFVIRHVYPRGGMGSVYRAYSSKMEREVILKFLKPSLLGDSGARLRLRTEARAAARLSHPNICTIHNIRSYKGQPFIVMAYIQGLPLVELLGKSPLPIEQSIQYTLQICKGLAVAHKHEVIHRDIKAENIIVEQHEGLDSDRVVIIDFGIAKLPASNVTKPGEIFGSLYTMSPEQASGHDVDWRTDIWSLGIVLYQMVTGELPFQGSDSDEVRIRIKEHEPVRPSLLNPKVPSALDKVIASCITKDIEQRYQSVGEVYEHLIQINNETYKAPKRIGIKESFQGIVHKNLRRVTIASAVIAGLMIIFFTFERSKTTIAVMPIDVSGRSKEIQEDYVSIHLALTDAISAGKPFTDKYAVIPATEFIHQDREWKLRDLYDIYKASKSIRVQLEYDNHTLRVLVKSHDTKKSIQLNTFDKRHSLSDRGTLTFLILEGIADVLNVNLKNHHSDSWGQGLSENQEALSLYYNALPKLEDREKEANILGAASLLEQATRLDSNFVKAFARLGEANWFKYERTKDPKHLEEAWASANKAIELNEKIAEGHIIKGSLFWRQNDTENAEISLERALELAPLNAEALLNLGIVYHLQGRSADAEEFITRSIKNNWGNWRAHNTLGWLYTKLNRNDEAIEVYKTVILLRPWNPEGYNNIGAQYEQLGRYEEALPHYLEGIKRNPEGALLETALTRRNLAGIYYRQGEYNKSIQEFDRSIELEPSAIDAWITKARAHALLSQDSLANSAWLKALFLSRKDIESNDRNAETYSYMIEALSRLERWPVLETELLKLEQLSTVEPLVYYRMAIAYAYLEKKRKASYSLKKAIDSGLRISAIEYLDAWPGDSVLVEERKEMIDNLRQRR